MKKHLIAAAVAAAVTAPAMAQNITIDGYIDRALQITNNTLDTSDAKAMASSAGTTFIGFSGSEDLGGGLKASFRINTDWSDVAGVNADSGQAFVNQGGFANSQAWVQLGNSRFGDIRAGTVNNETLTAVTSVASPGFATGVGSIYASSFGIHSGAGTGTTGWVGVVTAPNVATGYAGVRAIRQANSLYYYSPTINGVKFAAGFVPQNASNGAGTDTAGVKEMSLRYTGNGLDIMGTQIMYDVGPNAITTSNPAGTQVGQTIVGGSKFTHTTFAANYQVMSDLKVYAGWHKSTSSGTTIAVDGIGNNYGVSYNLNAATELMAQYANVSDKTAEAATGNFDRTLGSFGLNYNFSKRTRAYIRYADIIYKESAKGTAGNKANIAAFGVSHSF